MDVFVRVRVHAHARTRARMHACVMNHGFKHIKYFNTLPFLLWTLKLSHFWPVATSSTWFLSPFDIPRVISHIFLGFGAKQCPRFICVSVVLDPKSVKYLRSPGPFTTSVLWLHFYRTILGLNCSLENVFNLFLYFIKNGFFPWNKDDCRCKRALIVCELLR